MQPKDMQEYLPVESVEEIHRTTVRFLENVGVDFPYPEAVDVFKRHGVKTEGSRVYLSERELQDALATAPRQFTVEARNPSHNVTVGGGRSVLAPGYGAPFLVDAVDGVRAPTMADYHQLVKLAQALPNQDMSGFLLVEPGDLSADSAPAHMLHAHMLHSDKAFMGSAAGRRGVKLTMDMARILFGSDLADKYVCVSLINSLTPLRYSQEMLEALVGYAEVRQPVVIAALAMAGSTAPVTLAGVLALQNAELLAGVALTQLISPGTPVIIGSTSTNVDMKTGGLAIGSPELSQMIAAHAQMARFYNLPSRSGGALTDASYPDAQAGFESMMSLLTTINCGVDFVLHAAGILGSYLAFSFEKFVLDDEMCGMVRRLQQGIQVEPDTLAYEVAANVGVGGNYLAEDHTVQRCRSEFFRPAVSDRAGLDAWTQGGRLTAIDRAAPAGAEAPCQAYRSAAGCHHRAPTTRICRHGLNRKRPDRHASGWLPGLDREKDNMLVGYRMTPNPVIVSPEMTIGDAEALMREKKVHRFPVVDKKGSLIGIVSQSDILNARPSSATSLSIWEVTYVLSQIKVADVMTKKVVTVDEDCPIEEVARLMRQYSIGATPVMEAGRLVGIVTESDIFDIFLELMMAQEPGLRLTVVAPYFKGSMAQISSAITGAGGLIHAMNSFRSDDPDTWGCVLKVADISREELIRVVTPLVVKVLDLQEVRA